MRKITFYKLFEFIMAIIIILDCNSAYNRLVNYNFHISNISIAITIIFALATLFFFPIIKSGRLANIFNIMPFFLFFGIINFHNSFVSYAVKYLVLFPIILLLLHNEKEFNNFLKMITSIVYKLAIISLIFYFFGSVLNFIPSEDVLINWGGIKLKRTYYFLHFDTQLEPIFGLKLVRNSGIFTEAPMYSCILSFSIMLEMLFEKKNFKHIFIFLLTNITTLSSTGICLSIIILLLNFFKTKKIKYIYKFMLFPIIIIGSLFIADYLLNNKIENNNGSYSLRMDDYIASYNAWKDSPIIGNGFERTEKTISYMSLTRTSDKWGQSNAIGRYASEGGIIFLLLSFAPYLILLIKSIIEKNYDYFIFSLSMIFILCVTNVPYQMITIIMLAICYHYLLKCKIKIEKEGLE